MTTLRRGLHKRTGTRAAQTVLAARSQRAGMVLLLALTLCALVAPCSPSISLGVVSSALESLRRVSRTALGHAVRLLGRYAGTTQCVSLVDSSSWLFDLPLGFCQRTNHGCDRPQALRRLFLQDVVMRRIHRVRHFSREHRRFATRYVGSLAAYAHIGRFLDPFWALIAQALLTTALRRGFGGFPPDGASCRGGWYLRTVRVAGLRTIRRQRTGIFPLRTCSRFSCSPCKRSASCGCTGGGLLRMSSDDLPW